MNYLLYDKMVQHLQTQMMGAPRRLPPRNPSTIKPNYTVRRKMKGKGIDDVEFEDLQGYGAIADAAQRFGSDLLVAAPSLMDSGTKHGLNIAKQVDDRNRARDARLTAAGKTTKEARRADRQDAKLTRDVDKLAKRVARLDKKKEVKNDSKIRRTERKDSVKDAKLDRRLERIKK